MEYDYELMSSKSFSLIAGQYALVKINGSASSVLMSVEIEAGATFEIKTSLDDLSDVQGASVVTGLSLQDIVISGSPVASFSASTYNINMPSPNFIYVKNTSSGSEAIRVMMRGNR